MRTGHDITFKSFLFENEETLKKSLQGTRSDKTEDWIWNVESESFSNFSQMLRALEETTGNNKSLQGTRSDKRFVKMKMKLKIKETQELVFVLNLRHNR